MNVRAACILAAIACPAALRGEGGIERAEATRIETVARISPAVVCIYDSKQRGGGSGVLIDAEGYGLTNYHVVADSLQTRRAFGGLPDGHLYEMEVLGVDPMGDVAMFRLIGDKTFPFVPLGESGKVRLGDSVLALGNPFTLSEDYTPTVTVGMVTGLHRYQAGTGKNLVYSDCIQVDASINPGNSGGPLFNAAGEVIGINGRISVSTRGRLNVGFGYAIAMDQIKRFIPTLRAGLVARHGTLQATVAADPDGVLAFQRLAADSSAAKAGIQGGDRLIRFDGVTLTSPNHYVSLLGAYPADWPVPLTVERDGARRGVVVRLDVDKPKNQRPYAPDGEVNLREVRRVLRRFQTVSFGDRGRRPGSWTWSITRSYSDPTAAMERFDASQSGDGPIHIKQRFAESDRSARTITADASQVSAAIGDDEQTLTTDAELYWAAVFVLQRQLLEPLESLDPTSVAHVGADRHLSIDGGEDRLLEVLERPVLSHAKARFGFDAGNGRLLSIRVRDVPTGQEVLIELDGFHDIGGLTWPTELTVTAGSRRFTDVLSDWELEK